MGYTTVYIELIDADGEKTSRSYGCVDTDPSISNIRDLVDKVQEFTQCGINDVRVSKSVLADVSAASFNTYPSAPGAGSTVARRATFEYKISTLTTSNKKQVPFDLPDPKATYSIPNTNILDGNNSWFGDFGELFDDGVGVLGVQGHFHTDNQEQVAEATGNGSFLGGKVVD